MKPLNFKLVSREINILLSYWLLQRRLWKAQPFFLIETFALDDEGEMASTQKYPTIHPTVLALPSTSNKSSTSMLHSPHPNFTNVEEVRIFPIRIDSPAFTINFIFRQNVILERDQPHRDIHLPHQRALCNQQIHRRWYFVLIAHSRQDALPQHAARSRHSDTGAGEQGAYSTHGRRQG